jgi:NAD(P)-dependent dehydrogenase (short-subunit alcohol dehydrogenase family)
MRLNIAIIGSQGDLAQALTTTLGQEHSVLCYGKDEFNFLDKNSIIALADRIHTADVIICCAGVFADYDSWDMFTINTIAPVFLLERLATQKSNAHVIIVGSHSAMHTSWPGVTLTRLSYNVSKECLQSFVFGLAQSDNTNLTLSLLNPSRFQSKISAYSGYPINYVVESVQTIINSKASLLVVEYNNYK